MKKSTMKKQNWILVIAGIAVFYIGYILVSPITTNYDSLYALLAIFVIVSGLALVTVGLSLSFDKEADNNG
jgi:uncharacterized membrane protein HdeD (DUF308 family)